MSKIITITLTPAQIRAFPNRDWANPNDDVVVGVSELPNDDNPNPAVQYSINGEGEDSQECWSDLPRSWQKALRQAARG